MISNECIGLPNSLRVNVFVTGITLPGRSEVILAATKSRQLQLRAVFSSSSRKFCCPNKTSSANPNE